MPWCEPCGRFYNPNTMSAEGRCPDGHEVAPPAVGGDTLAAKAKVPWHFWVLLVALLAYLGWRAVQGISWLF